MTRQDPSGSGTAASSVGEPGAQQRAMPFQSIDLLGLYSVLRANILTIFAITVASIIAMYVYLTSLPPVYTASTQIILDSREERVTPVQAVVSNLDVNNPVMAGEVIIIKSNIFLGKVVDELDLLNTPEFDPRRERPENPLAYLRRLARGGEKAHVFASRQSEDTLRSWVITELRRDLSISQLGVSYAIGISLENTNPQLAADIANAIAEKYIDSQLETKLVATERANEWLSRRLEELSIQVEQADEAVVQFRAQMIDSVGGNEESINQLLAELNSRLVGSATERADAEVRMSEVETLLEDGGVVLIADVLTSPLLETLQRQRAELAASKAQMATIFGAMHPDMIRITAQITDIDRSIEGELRRRVKEMRSDVKVTRNREVALKQQIETVSERAETLSKASVRLDQLERTAQATRLVYENFLARYKETSAQADFQAPEARVIGKADVPAVPSGPRKTMLMAGAGFLGMTAAIAFVFLQNLLRAPVSTAEELRLLTHLPTMTVLPKFGSVFSGKKWLAKQLVLETASPFLDRIQSIRTHLFQDWTRKDKLIVLITSSVPNEGKSSLSCGLAKVLAQPKKSVLLIDVDLRRPDIRHTLELPMQGGCLVDYLDKKEKVTNLVMHSDLLGADVITPTKTAENPSEILTTPAFSGLLTRLSGRYDIIILNGPPVLHLADAVVLGNLADKTLLAVRGNKTSSRAVVNSLQRLQAGNVNVAGMVLTMVRSSYASRQDLEMYKQSY